jgi:hypothetical protein
VAEGGGLLNRYTVKSRIGGSNPPLSAISPVLPRVELLLRWGGGNHCIAAEGCSRPRGNILSVRPNPNK